MVRCTEMFHYNLKNKMFFVFLMFCFGLCTLEEDKGVRERLGVCG